MKLHLDKGQFALIYRKLGFALCEDCKKRRTCVHAEIVDDDGDKFQITLCRPCMQVQFRSMIGEAAG